MALLPAACCCVSPGAACLQCAAAVLLRKLSGQACGGNNKTERLQG